MGLIKQFINKTRKKKAEVIISDLLKWLIGFALLVIVVIAIIILMKSNNGAADFIKDLFRFGGAG